MSAPLKLRLRELPSSDYLEKGQRGIAIGQRLELLHPAILEFENPIDGSWHPVEVVNHRGESL